MCRSRRRFAHLGPWLLRQFLHLVLIPYLCFDEELLVQMVARIERVVVGHAAGTGEGSTEMLCLVLLVEALLEADTLSEDAIQNGVVTGGASAGPEVSVAARAWGLPALPARRTFPL